VDNLHKGKIMADDDTDRGPTNGACIKIEEEYEIVFWTRELGVSRLQLARAIEQVGPGVAAVRRLLSR
jgi:hypothetical protein